MSNNGLTKFVTSAKAIIGIVVVLVALIVWFVTMKEDVKAYGVQLKTNTPKIQGNSENIIRLQADVTYIKKGIDRIEKKL